VTKKRCYKQYCGLAKAMDIVGERWTLLILRDLMIGPWRYSDLLVRMKGITTNLLSIRLKDMEQNGLIQKTMFTSIGSPHVYELTPLGLKLEPVILGLSQFGFNFMHEGPQADEQVDPGRALLNLKTHYRTKPKGVVTFCFSTEKDNFEPEYYQVDFSKNGVNIRFGQILPSNVSITLSMKTYGDLAFRSADVAKLETQGKLSVQGDRKMWIRFLDSFGFN